MYPYEVIQELEEDDYVVRDARDGAMVAGPYTSKVTAYNEAERLWHLHNRVENPTGRGPRGFGGGTHSQVGGAGDSGTNMDHGWMGGLGGHYRG